MHLSMLGDFSEGKDSNFYGSVDTGTKSPPYLALCKEVLRFSQWGLDKIRSGGERLM